jgi:hypothetical protein
VSLLLLADSDFEHIFLPLLIASSQDSKYHLASSTSNSVTTKRTVAKGCSFCIVTIVTNKGYARCSILIKDLSKYFKQSVVGIGNHGNPFLELVSSD